MSSSKDEATSPVSILEEFCQWPSGLTLGHSSPPTSALPAPRPLQSSHHQKGSSTSGVLGNYCYIAMSHYYMCYKSNICIVRQNFGILSNSLKPVVRPSVRSSVRSPVHPFVCPFVRPPESPLGLKGPISPPQELELSSILLFGDNKTRHFISVQFLSVPAGLCAVQSRSFHGANIGLNHSFPVHIPPHSFLSGDIKLV